MKSSKGFNTVELMTALCILGILSAVSIPFIINYLPRYRLNSTAREITFALNTARLKSVSSRAPYGIFFDLSSNPKSFVLFKDNNGDSIFNEGDKTELGIAYIPNDIKLNIKSSLNNIVIFSDVGTSEAGYLYIENGKKDIYKVVINNTGRVSLDNG